MFDQTGRTHECCLVNKPRSSTLFVSSYTGPGDTGKLSEIPREHLKL